MKKIKLSQAIVVEGRDDVDAVSKACDALIIPTHGFGITKETWQLIEKAHAEKDIIILTDPDFSGEEIRRKLSEKYPDAIQAYIAREDAILGDDIGVENAAPEVIAEAIKKAIEREGSKIKKAAECNIEWKLSDLIEFGIVGEEGSAELRNKLCAELGIGHANNKAFVKKLNQWNIGREELEQAIKSIKEKEI